jgi:hypothetical protein
VLPPKSCVHVRRVNSGVRFFREGRVVAYALTSVFLALGACIVVANWYLVIANYRLKSQGVDRHVSLIPALTQIFVVVAAVIAYQSAVVGLPPPLFWFIALSDVSLYSILYFPVALLRRGFRA